MPSVRRAGPRGVRSSSGGTGRRCGADWPVGLTGGGVLAAVVPARGCGARAPPISAPVPIAGSCPHQGMRAHQGSRPQQGSRPRQGARGLSIESESPCPDVGARLGRLPHRARRYPGRRCGGAAGTPASPGRLPRRRLRPARGRTSGTARSGDARRPRGHAPALRHRPQIGRAVSAAPRGLADHGGARGGESRRHGCAPRPPRGSRPPSPRGGKRADVGAGGVRAVVLLDGLRREDP